MNILSVFTDERVIDDNGSKQEERNVLVNLDHVEVIEFNAHLHSLDFWFPNLSRQSFHVSHAADEKTVMTKLFHAMQPLYEARVSFVGAVKVTLDLRGV